MPAKKLYHTTGTSFEGDVSVTWGSIQEIPHNGKRVVFMQARPGGGRRKPYAIIPGYKAGEYEHAGKTTLVEVETVPLSDQPAVREKVQQLAEGPVTFW